MTKLRCMLCCLMICTITIDARTVNDIYKTHIELQIYEHAVMF